MRMHRSSSTTRVSDDYSAKYSTSSSSPTPSQVTNNRSSIDGINIIHNGISSIIANQLPVYNPTSHVAKKERSRLRFAENAVHLIPLVLVLCAIILWFFSNPVDMVRKGDSIVVGVDDGLKAAGAGAVEVDGTQNSLLTHLELEDADLGRHSMIRKPSG